MPSGGRSEYTTRERILELLSDEEVAKVSTAETQVRLADGDEYLDLEKLDEGVRQAHGQTTVMGRLLPRSAVRDATWSKIVSHLGGAARHH
jgi:hypothetical protein